MSISWQSSRRMPTGYYRSIVWRSIDQIGYRIARSLGPCVQMRLGVLMLVQSAGFVFWMPFSGEQVGIFLMSALALFYGGLGVIVTAVLAINESDDDDIEDLNNP